MYSDQIKHRAIVHYKYFLRSVRKVASIYNIGKSTLSRWLHRDGISINKKKRTSIVERIAPVIDSVLSANPFTTTKMLSNKVQKLLNLNVSASTCSRAVRYNKYSYKKTKVQVQKDVHAAQLAGFKPAYLNANNIVSIASILSTVILK